MPLVVRQRQKQMERFFKKGYKNRSLRVCEGQGVVSCTLALCGEASSTRRCWAC